MDYNRDAYGSIVVDFMQRTKTNLVHIYRHVEFARQSGQGPQLFETTQLINSALGIFVFPKEVIFSILVDKQIQSMGHKALIPFVKEYPELSFRSLMTKLRNAFAHHNFTVQVSDGEIVALKIWNDAPRRDSTPRERRIRSWPGLVLTVDEIYEFMMFVADGVTEGDLTTEDLRRLKDVA